MPCRTEDGGSYDREKIELLTRIACDAMTKLENLREKGGLNAETLVWWADHQRVDRERIAREQANEQTEQLRRQARNKLTPEEQRALGL